MKASLAIITHKHITQATCEQCEAKATHTAIAGNIHTKLCGRHAETWKQNHGFSKPATPQTTKEKTTKGKPREMKHKTQTQPAKPSELRNPEERRRGGGVIEYRKPSAMDNILEERGTL